MNDTSTRPDGMAGKIEEEFEKYLYEPLACLDRDDLEFIENDNGDQFISLDEADRVARDNAENGFTSGFHAASKPLMEENEILKKQSAEWKKCYVSRTNEVIALRGDRFELREALDKVTKQAFEYLSDDYYDPYTLKIHKIRDRFNLDNDSKGEMV